MARIERFEDIEAWKEARGLFCDGELNVAAENR
jgi:hypothetical protein